MEVIGRFRIRTENNCVGRDIVQIPGDQVLFGKYSGTEVKLDGTDYLVVKEDDIFAILG